MKKIIFTVLFLPVVVACSSQEKKRVADHKLGLQLGYAYLKVSKIDLGLNYYWSINPNFHFSNKLPRVHTFGPFASADINFVDGVTYLGQRAGINYHYSTILSLRFSPAIEHYVGKDFRAGADVGISLLGLFVYYGYYSSISDETLKGVMNNRFGIRMIFNVAPITTTPIDI